MDNLSECGRKNLWHALETLHQHWPQGKANGKVVPVLNYAMKAYGGVDV
jgi:hypothetical protein